MGIYSYLFAIGCPLWFFAVCVFFSLLRPLFPGATTLTENIFSSCWKSKCWCTFLYQCFIMHNRTESIILLRYVNGVYERYDLLAEGSVVTGFSRILNQFYRMKSITTTSPLVRWFSQLPKEACWIDIWNAIVKT